MRTSWIGFGAIVFGAVLGASPRDAAAASTVRIVTNSAEVSGCRFRGTLHADMDSFFSSDTRKLYQELRKKAADLDGNVVLLFGSVTVIHKSNGSNLSVDGDAYKCGGAISDSAASPSSGSAGPEVRQSDKLLSELQDLERDLFEAQKTGDREKAAKLIADDASIKSPKKSYTKAEFLSALKKNSPLQYIEFEGMKAAREGDTAVLTGVVLWMTQSGRNSKLYKFRVTNRYSKANGSWQLASSESATEE
jgi:uncharacterized Zn-binding protein involved in type VI secretion